jgi:hypothetical protein
MTIKMDLYELERNFREILRQAAEHNQSNFVVERRSVRNSQINNTENYQTGNVMHEVQSTQIDNWDLWYSLGDLFPLDSPERQYILNPPIHIVSLLDYMDRGYGNYYGEIDVSLLREVNHETGIHRAILMIYCSPHKEFVDGDILATSYSYGDEIHEAITNIFDESPYTSIEFLSEYEILQFIQNDNDTERLLTDYFQPGFISMNYFDDQNQPARPFFVFDAVPEIVIRPPPIQNDIDVAFYYNAEMNNQNNLAPWENNIIPYWTENEDIDLMNVRG